MPKFSANLTMLFNEVDFLDRFERASRAGFKGVECQFPYQWEKEVLAEKLDKHGLELVLHNITAVTSRLENVVLPACREERENFKRG